MARAISRCRAFLARLEHAQCNQRVAIFAVKQNKKRSESGLGATMPARRAKKKTKSSTSRQNIDATEDRARESDEKADESLEQTKTAKEDYPEETSPGTSDSATPTGTSSGDKEEQPKERDSAEPKVVIRKLRPRKPKDIPMPKYGGIMTRARAKTTPTSPESDHNPLTLDAAPPPHKKAREDSPAPASSGQLVKSQVKETGKEAAQRKKNTDQDVGVAREDKPVEVKRIIGGGGGGEGRGPCEGVEEEGTGTKPGSTSGAGRVAERARRYWLMKSEPESRIIKGVDIKFGIDELASEEQQTVCWDGVRNYEARNILRDEMKVGDLAFFYHSNCKNPGIAGIVEVIREGYVDHTQFDKSDPHYDAESHQDCPKWYMVDVRLVRRMKRFITLAELKAVNRELCSAGRGGPLSAMPLLSRSRLSVQSVSEQEFDFILSLEDDVAP